MRILPAVLMLAWACGSSTVERSQGGGDDSSKGGEADSGGTTSNPTGGSASGGKSGTSGSSGAPTTGGVPSTGGSAGTGGAAGSGGSSGAVSVLGSFCDMPGTLACAGNHQHVTLICGPDGVWISNQTCPAGEACNSTPGFDQGTCAPRIARCASHYPGYRYCRSGAVVECGPDSIDLITVETCPDECLEGVCVDIGTAGAGGAG